MSRSPGRSTNYSRSPAISIQGISIHSVIPETHSTLSPHPRRKSQSSTLFKSNSFGNAATVSKSTAVLQGAHIIGQLKNLRHSLADSQAFDIQQLIEEVLLLVSMKTDQYANDPETMSRLTKLVDLSKHPVHRPVAEWILNDFFDQETRGPSRSNSIYHRISRVSGVRRHSVKQKFTKAVKKVATQQKIVNKLDAMHHHSTKFSSKMISKAMSDPICNYFNQHCDQWDFDIFEFEEICKGNGTNSFTAFTVHIILPVAESLDLDTDLVAMYFHDIQNNYLSDKSVVYHNALHAADVLYNMWFFLRSHYYKKAVQISELQIFSGLMAALVHDVGHPGTNNKYQIDSQSRLALLYNDQSVLENHHMSLAWNTLQKPRCNFLRNQPLDIRQRLRKIVIQCVLGTDMTKHSAQINMLQSMIKLIEQNTANELEIDLGIKDDMIELALHVADISNPAKNFPIAKAWAYKISDEFFLQGDLQKLESLDVLPLFDREKTKVHQSQIGFIEYVVQPLFRIWGGIITEVKDTVNVMDSHKKQWKEMAIEETVDKPNDANAT